MSICFTVPSVDPPPDLPKFVNHQVTLIETLQKHGITADDIHKLKAEGYYTVEDIVYTSKEELATINGMNQAKADKLQSEASKIVKIEFKSANQIHQLRLNIIYITTGSSELNRILGGGIETGSITEIIGECTSGKTQMCHTLAVTCQLPIDMGGAEGKCMIIDCGGTFRPSRILGIAKKFKINPDIVLKNIVCARACNTDHLTQLLIMANALMTQARYALLIVDGTTELYRTDYYSGRVELAAAAATTTTTTRHQHSGKFLRMLLRIADVYGVAVVITTKLTVQVDIKKSIVPHTVAHGCTTGLYLKKGRGILRMCKIYQSPHLPETDAVFVINANGIGDVKE